MPDIYDQTASQDKKLTDGMHKIINNITNVLIKENAGFIVVEDQVGEFQWFIDSLSLMAKQVNLCDSCMLLLENGMEQEAFLLARSQFNNMLWIRYLMHDDEEHSRYKEYTYQPTINQIFQDKNLLKLIDEFQDDIDDRLKSNDVRRILDSRIESNKKALKAAGISESMTMSISKLAFQEFFSYGYYVTFYNDASKFEHADVSTTKEYRKQILPDYSRDVIFSFDLGKSDKAMWYKVFGYSHEMLFWSYESIANKILNEETQLLDTNHITGKPVYSSDALKNIMIEFSKIMKIFESDTKNLREINQNEIKEAIAKMNQTLGEDN